LLEKICGDQDVMTDTPTVINVGSFIDLDNAIYCVDSGQLLNGQPINADDVVINFTNTIDATADNHESVFETPGDLLALDNPLAHVTIEGNGFTYDGGGEVRGFIALDGNVTIDNLVVAGTVAAGGNGLAGGGAGLGGAVFVGNNATVTLTNDTFIGNLAVGGDGGGIDPNATASGGGGLGGVGGSASDADGIFANAITGNSTTGPGGGGGGGVGSQAGILYWTDGGSESAPGVVCGSGSAGYGAGQAQDVKQEENVLGWDVWSGRGWRFARIGRRRQRPRLAIFQQRDHGSSRISHTRVRLRRARTHRRNSCSAAWRGGGRDPALGRPLQFHQQR
jgi:hypothetical protein